ncbi:FliA/WhiG family RNA polymerase sigma factor [Demequina zhanjiangensis]|uniref:RNA polymerase sigma factor n=1 Tax=Demequina zhanjiangensis TaxID=3051659 RepID=A0ABT8G4E8_9MICO|nr:FliA/WhiG family RNA polymerase sigma factor [Demequina sp. SYSU T00b26]MDN4473584.1 FliA/WhiG family RNA polymerase sigma factor [Demequina sp. SYSU T00b26]
MSELNAVLKHLESQTEPHQEPAAATLEAEPRWHALKHGDESARREARDALITDYAPLVSHVATRMIARLPESVELGDLVSYGMFGLIDAVEKFEPERGFKFETYASQRIRGAIIDELRAADWVPRSVRAKARAVEVATRQLEQSVQGPVTDEAVADALEWRTAEVRTVRAQVALSHVAALDTLGGIGDDASALDTVAALSVPGAARAVEHHETRSLLADAIQQVREREQEVLRLYYYENLTLAQIGRILGVTESRVSQIHSAAVKKLRETLVKTGAFS